MANKNNHKVAIVMGSQSDYATMKYTVNVPVSYTHLTLPTTPYV